MNIQELLSIAVTFVVLGVAITFGLDAMQDVESDVQCPELYTYNASATVAGKACYLTTNSSIQRAITESGDSIGDSITAVGNVSEKSGTLTTVIMAGLVISVLLASFYFSRR
jgi:hypothetical protein